MHPFRFGTSIREVTSRQQCHDLARRVEDGGYSTFCAADHLGLASAFPTLVAAAEATSSLRVGTLVVNNDFHRPLRLAQDAATTDVLTGGRLELGLGSGWSEPEYDLLGIPYERPSVRAARLAETIPLLRHAWAGELHVSVGGHELRAVPEPVQRPHPPLLIGGNSDAVLRLAAREADIVGITGLAWRTGRLFASAITAEGLAGRVDFVKQEAGARFEGLELNVLAHATQVTDDPSPVVASVAERFGVEPALIEASPFALIGPVPAIVDKLVALRERLGISYWIVFEDAFEAFTPVVAALAGT